MENPPSPRYEGGKWHEGKGEEKSDIDSIGLCCFPLANASMYWCVADDPNQRLTNASRSPYGSCTHPYINRLLISSNSLVCLSVSIFFLVLPLRCDARLRTTRVVPFLPFPVPSHAATSHYLTLPPRRGVIGGEAPPGTGVSFSSLTPPFYVCVAPSHRQRFQTRRCHTRIVSSSSTQAQHVSLGYKYTISGSVLVLGQLGKFPPTSLTVPPPFPNQRYAPSPTRCWCCCAHQYMCTRTILT